MGKVVRLSSFVPLAEDMDAAVEAFIVHCRAKNLSPRTVEFYQDRLASFRRYTADTVPGIAPKEVTPQLIRQYLDHTRAACSAATANHNLNALRIFLGFLVADGVLDENPALSVRDALSAYIRRRGEIAGQSLLFVTHYGTALDRFRVRDLLDRRAEAAGMPTARVGCHKWRHTFAKQWLLNGGDAFSLKAILGHATMEMVSNYVNLVQAEVQSVHARFSPADRLQATKQTSGRKRLR